MISASYFYAKNITVSCLYKKRKMKNLEKEYCTICKCVSTFHHRHNFILLFDAVNLRLFILGKQNYYYIIALMLVGKSQFVNNIKFKCHLQTYRIIICATAVALTCLKQQDKFRPKLFADWSNNYWFLFISFALPLSFN